MIDEQESRAPYQAEHCLIQAVQRAHQQEQQSGEVRVSSEESHVSGERFWGTLIGELVGGNIEFRFTDSTLLNGREAGQKIMEELRNGHVPHVDVDGQIGFKSPHKEETLISVAR